MKKYNGQKTKNRIWIIVKKPHMVTTGFQFEGYEIVSYLGIVAGEVVLGTGFLSEFTSSIC